MLGDARLIWIESDFKLLRQVSLRPSFFSYNQEKKRIYNFQNLYLKINYLAAV